MADGANGPWVYVRSEPGLWTVGYNDPRRGWQPDSDHSDRENAAARCNYLNGGTTVTEQRLQELLVKIEALENSVRVLGSHPALI